MMTQNNSNNNCSQSRDPALPGDPWTRLRYEYGQLLGAEDFTQEQTHFVLRRRLHNALLHGYGTAWGLRVDLANNASQLLINNGLGYDFLGRALYVDKNEQPPCLSVSQIHTNEKFWGKLAPVKKSNPVNCPAIGDLEEVCAKSATEETVNNTEAITVTTPCNEGDRQEEVIKKDDVEVKIAYVVITYHAGLSHKVPAITASCDMSADEAMVFSRISDHYFAEIVTSPPESPHDMLKTWLNEKKDTENTAHCWHTARDHLLDYILNCDDFTLNKFWNKQSKAPLLLAKIELTKQGNETIISKLDNKVRALLPSMQLIAEQTLGQKLSGEDKRKPLKLLSIKQVDPDKKKYKFELHFSRPLAASTLDKESIKVYQLENEDWGGSLNLKIKIDCDIATIEVTNCLDTDCVTLQFYLVGSQQKPIVSKAGMPLDGWWDEAVSGLGRGKDISFVRTWKKDSQGESHEDAE